MWIHKIEIQGSNEIEKKIENILTQMKIDYAQSSFGQIRDEGDIFASVTKRELNIRMHNGWKYITNENVVILEPPNQFGIM